MKKKTSPERKFMLKNVILSYPDLVHGTPDQRSGKIKFSAAFITTDKTNIADLAAAELAAIRDQFGPQATAKMVSDGEIKSTWRRNKADQKKVNAPNGFVNARSEQRPGIVDRAAKPIIGKDVETELYPGAVVNVTLFAYYYNTEGNSGISFGLNNIQKVKDGTRLDNRKSAEEEFDACLDEETDGELPI